MAMALERQNYTGTRSYIKMELFIVHNMSKQDIKMIEGLDIKNHMVSYAVLRKRKEAAVVECLRKVTNQKKKKENKHADQ